MRKKVFLLFAVSVLLLVGMVMIPRDTPGHVQPAYAQEEGEFITLPNGTKVPKSTQVEVIVSKEKGPISWRTMDEVAFPKTPGTFTVRGTAGAIFRAAIRGTLGFIASLAFDATSANIDAEIPVDYSNFMPPIKIDSVGSRQGEDITPPTRTTPDGVIVEGIYRGEQDGMPVFDMPDVTIHADGSYSHSSSSTFGTGSGSSDIRGVVGGGGWGAWSTQGGYHSGAAGIGPSPDPAYYSGSDGGSNSLSGESQPFLVYDGPSLVTSVALDAITVDPREEWLAVDALIQKDAWLAQYGVDKIHDISRRTFYDVDGNTTASFISIKSPVDIPWPNHGEICALDSCQRIHGYAQISLKGLPNIVATVIGQRMEVSIKLFGMGEERVIAQAVCPACREPKAYDGVVSRQTFIVSVALTGSRAETVASLERLLEDLTTQFPAHTEWVGGDAYPPQAFVVATRHDGTWMSVEVVNTTDHLLVAHPIHFSSMGEYHEQLIILSPGLSVHKFMWPANWTDTITVLYVQNGATSSREYWDGLPLYGDRIKFYLQRDIFCPGPNILLYHDVVSDRYWEEAPKDCKSGKCSDSEAAFYYRTASQFENDLAWLNRAGSNAILAFDDASEGWISIVLPLLEEYRRRAIFFVSTGSDVVTPEFLQTLEAHSFAQVESHTDTHRKLTELSDEEVRRELRVSREIIKDAIGRNPSMLALPYGDGGKGGEFERILGIAREEGYSGLRTSQRGQWRGSRLDVAWVATAQAERPELR